MENNSNEIWRDVVGYEDTHQVSNLGRVRVKERVINTSTGKRKYKSKLLNIQTSVGGYKFVILIVNNNRKTAYIHRLIAEAFIPNPDNLPCVNHKDEDKSNNIVDNLEWCTVEYNNTYGTRLERVSKTRSKPIIQYSLDDKFIRIWDSTKEAAKFIGCCRENINRCLIGATKTAFGFKWKYNDGIQIKRNINK